MKRTPLFVMVPLLALAIACAFVWFADTTCACGSTSPVRSGSVVPAAPMLEPRSGHTATLLPDGRVLIAGGMRRNQDFYRSAELYDPETGKFTPAGAMKLARVGHVAVLLPNNKVLIAGGWIGHGCTDEAELYDSKTGTFTTIAHMTARRGQPSATLLENGDVLIAGGADRDTPGGIASAELFHSSTLTFERIGSMQYGRISHTASLLDDGKVLIAGGRGEKVNNSAELYDPKTKQFVPTGSMQEARYKHTAGLLPDGKVLIAGGSDERDWNGNLKSAEIYDPKTGKFTGTSAMNDSRFKLPHEAAQLGKGRLLIAGGSKQAEIFDPATAKFIVANGQMEKPWHFMTETRLEDGRVLLAGGYANDPEATAQTWLYRP
jgi:hypothetical protein